MTKKTVGITCSTFDLLHAGHIIMLEECKKYCDYLICALQVDPTIDRPTKEFFDEFPFVNYFKETSQKMLSNLIQLNIKPDFIMFDGPEPPNIAYEDIILLEDVIDDGTYFCMHDWDYYRPYDKKHSTKSITIREYMENSERWELQEQLHADIKNSNFDNLEYDSVGLYLYKFKK